MQQLQASLRPTTTTVNPTASDDLDSCSNDQPAAWPLLLQLFNHHGRIWITVPWQWQYDWHVWITIPASILAMDLPALGVLISCLWVTSVSPLIRYCIRILADEPGTWDLTRIFAPPWSDWTPAARWTHRVRRQAKEYQAIV